MTVTLRPVTDADIPAMAAIRAQEWETESFWTNRIRLYVSGEHSPQLASPARAAFVTVENETVIGFVAGHRTRRHQCDAELQWLNVAKPQRGRGIAHKLLAVMGAWFVQQGARRVCVNVAPDNLAARGLYTNHGATPFGDYWMVWEDARRIAEGKKNT